MKRVYWLLGALGIAVTLYALSRTQRGAIIAADIVGGAVDKAKELIAGEEGLRLDVYRDPGAGAWTVGWGHLVIPGDGFHPYGSRKSCTREEADALFKKDTEIATRDVDDAVKVLLTSNQRAALISFVYNIGGSQFRSSTMLKMLNASDFSGAANQFSRWIYDDGKIVPGLITRRERERALFIKV